MADETTTEIDELQYMSTNELAELYHDLHGQPVGTRHRQYLIRKLAWRIQANAMGDISDRARKRARELANDSDIRVMAPQSLICPPQTGESRSTTKRYSKRDPRIPAVGSAIVRQYKGKTIRVIVHDTDQGFEYNGQRYRTLTAVAKIITGNHINGFRFFMLGGKS
tara:strand:- start:13912 stop:14409 length:498 start_codon:yes stop_codon:yes gene_type:complete